MKIVLQRVSQASVEADGKITGEIGNGLLVFLGVSSGDTTAQADRLADKISRLRIFPDENGKTNLSAGDVKGDILIVSQFTLYADCRKGNRPSFINAGDPVSARALYEYFADICEGRFNKTARGVFGAEMKVFLVNDGPFTIILEDEG